MRLPHFIGGSFPSKSPYVAQERTVNFYVEVVQTPGAPNTAVLYPTPGVEAFGATVVDAPVRALYAEGDQCWAVIGDTLYEVFADGTKTARGTVAHVDTNPATICGNGQGHIFTTSGNKGYILETDTNTFTEVRASATTMGAYLGGYFLALDAATGTLHLSDLFDGLTWDPTQFAQRTNAADPWIAMKVTHNEVWLFGSKTSEAWYPSGGFPIPLDPIQGGQIEYGIAAPFSAAKVGSTVMFVSATSAGQGQIVGISGMTAHVVSHHGLDQVIQGYVATSQIADAIADSYEEHGHTFYVLTFPDADATWVYDLAAPGVWCERGTWISEEFRYAAWRVLWHAFAFGMHLIGDRETGVIYRMSTDLQWDVEDRPIRRLRRAPTLNVEQTRVFYQSFTLALQPGVGTGLGSGQGAQPRVELSYSNDYGTTWVSAGTRSVGRQGDYGHVVEWHGLGSGRGRVFEIVMSDPVPYCIADAFLKIRNGRAA